MNDKWIKISYEWADRYRNGEPINFINSLDYLDILGLYETCWLSYEFDEEDKSVFGYPNNE